MVRHVNAGLPDPTDPSEAEGGTLTLALTRRIPEARIAGSANLRCQDTTADRFGKSLVSLCASDSPMHLRSGLCIAPLADVISQTFGYSRAPSSRLAIPSNSPSQTRQSFASSTPTTRSKRLFSRFSNQSPHVRTMVASRRSQAPWRHVSAGSSMPPQLLSFRLLRCHARCLQFSAP